MGSHFKAEKTPFNPKPSLAYGGLRGAVGFSLVEMIDVHVVPPKPMFVTTTLAVVIFTMFFQGTTDAFFYSLL